MTDTTTLMQFCTRKKPPMESNHHFFSIKAMEQMAAVRAESYNQDLVQNEASSSSCSEHFARAQADTDTISLLSIKAASWEPHSRSLLVSRADI